MTQRYGRRDAEMAYSLLRDVMGKREARSRADVGGWRLDVGYGPVYTIYEICQVGQGIGIDTPLGFEARRAREFCDAARFAAKAVRLALEPHLSLRAEAEAETLFAAEARAARKAEYDAFMATQRIEDAI